MNNMNAWYTYFYQLDELIKSQVQKINQLEKQVENLKKEITEIQKKPYTNIEKIEYKFDQLKVETLSGTLNIGLNPTDQETIEDFAVNNGKLNVPNNQGFSSPQEIPPRVQQEIHRFLAEECDSYIKSIEPHYHCNFDEAHRQFIIEDLRNQIDQRISTYLTGEDMRELPENNIYGYLVNKIKEDIYQSINIYLQNVPNHFRGGVVE